MKRILKLLARLYPSAWRNRYGAEYEALLEEGTPRGKDVMDVAWAAAKLWVTSRDFVRVVMPCALAGGLVAAAVSLAVPVLYSSGTVVTMISVYHPSRLVDESGQTVVLANERHQPQDRLFLKIAEAAFTRDYLASVIEEKNLYAPQRAKASLADVVETMRRAIQVRPAARSLSPDEDLSSFTVQFDYSDPHVAQQVDSTLIYRLVTFPIRSSGIMPTVPPSLVYQSYRIDHAPSLPQKPDGPSRIEWSVIGILGGLLCGLCLAAARTALKVRRS